MGHSYMTTPRESEDLMREVILLAACNAGEVLPQTPDLPADVFTACLTTPIKARSLVHRSRVRQILWWTLTQAPFEEHGHEHSCMP